MRNRVELTVVSTNQEGAWGVCGVAPVLAIPTYPVESALLYQPRAVEIELEDRIHFCRR